MAPDVRAAPRPRPHTHIRSSHAELGLGPTDSNFTLQTPDVWAAVENVGHRSLEPGPAGQQRRDQAARRAAAFDHRFEAR